MQQQHVTFLCVTDKELPWDVYQAVNDKKKKKCFTGQESLGKIHYMWWLCIN